MIVSLELDVAPMDNTENTMLQILNFVEDYLDNATFTMPDGTILAVDVVMASAVG